MYHAHKQIRVLTYYNKQRIILTNRKVSASLPIFKDLVCARQHTREFTTQAGKPWLSPTTGAGSMSSADSQVTGLHRTDLRTSSLGAWKDCICSSKERLGGALAFLPGAYELSWTPARGVPPRGRATVSSGRMRSFLQDSGSSLVYRIHKPLLWSRLCRRPILKTTFKNASASDTPAGHCPAWKPP